MDGIRSCRRRKSGIGGLANSIIIFLAYIENFIVPIPIPIAEGLKVLIRPSFYHGTVKKPSHTVQLRS